MRRISAENYLANIPKELQELPQWALTAPSGAPLQPDGIAASPTDPSTWFSFDEVLEAIPTTRSHGICFALSEDDPFTAVDLDHCVQDKSFLKWSTEQEQAGRWKDLPNPRELVLTAETYTEVSRSETGIRMIGYGKLPGTGRHCGDFEIYDQRKFVTVTGWRVKREFDLSNIQRWIDTVVTSLPPQVEISDLDLDWEVVEHPRGLGDDKMLQRLLRDPQAEKLWNGDCSDYRGGNGAPDRSAADMALVNRIATEVGPYPAIIKRLLLQSGLKRQKWDRVDYLRNTISKALATREDLVCDIRVAGKSSPPSSVPDTLRYQPFPTRALPQPVRDFVVDQARSMKVDAAMIAVPSPTRCCSTSSLESLTAAVSRNREV